MVAKMKQFALDYGKHFGKYDLERWGDFGEMSYMHGVSYGVFALKLSDREKGHQMFPGFPKLKAGLQDCYFDHEFKRIFTGEAYLPLYKIYAKQNLQQTKKFLTPEGFKNPGFPKKHSTPGDQYGTFSGRYDAFSAKTRPPPKKGVVLRNFYTSPGKKGSFGYAQICINRYPEYQSGDRYDEKPPPGRKYTLTNPPFKGPSKPSLFDTNPYPEPAGADTSRPLYNKLVDLKWLKGKEFVPVGRGKPIIFLMAFLWKSDDAAPHSHKSQNNGEGNPKLDQLIKLSNSDLPDSQNRHSNVRISYGDQNPHQSYRISQHVSGNKHGSKTEYKEEIKS